MKVDLKDAPAEAPIGVLLLNLGGPESQEAVEPFLYDLFSDREIIQLPGGALFQSLFARLIARLRGPKVRANYALIGGGSPILELSRRQAAALEAMLNGTDSTITPHAGPSPRYRVDLAMRYRRPSTEETLTTFRKAGVRRLIAVTLYPQFSAATTGSSLSELRRSAARMNWDLAPSLRVIDRYGEHPGYLDAMTRSVEEALDGFPENRRAEVVLLFSAHGLPMRFVRGGDPYVDEIRGTREGIVKRLRDHGRNNAWRLGYQSRTGPVKWIEPYTDRVIEELAESGTKEILIIPISFVSDHIETLYECDLLFGERARRLGIADFRRIRTLNDDPIFISTLADLVREAT